MRWAVEDRQRRAFVLERLLPGQATRRETLASLVRHLARHLARHLSDRGASSAVGWLEVVSESTEQPLQNPSPSLRPYPGVLRNPHLEPELVDPLRPPSGQPPSGQPQTSAPGFVLQAHGAAWMLSPFVPNDPLPRPGFLDHEARGTALADFLAGMRSAALSLDPALLQEHLADLERLDLPAYARELSETIAERQPELEAPLRPVLAALEPLFLAWDDLPLALNHGDFHPLNVLWTGEEIAGVIDWEFAGLKPELYDAANMLGCCGFEHPRAFASGLVPAFLRGLRNHGLLTRENAQWLPLLVLGLRLAWLSEWLRKGDQEMLDLELTYLSMLTDALPDMAQAWRV